METGTIVQPSCLHCGSQLPAQHSERFCCSGCSFVHTLLRNNGLDTFYDIRKANPPTCPIPVKVSDATYATYDNPEFVERMTKDGHTIRLFIEGVNCSACLWLLDQLPQLCSDIQSLNMNMSTSTIEIVRSAHGSFSKIAQTLDHIGFRPRPLRINESSIIHQRKERHRDLIRLGIAGAATGNIMILAVSLYGGAAGKLGEEFRLLAGLLSIPVLTFCAWPFYRSALGALRTRQLNIDVPIVIAIFAGAIASIWSLARSSANVYFDSLSMLVFLLLSSRFALKGIQNQQFQATNLESDLLLSTVKKLKTSGEIEMVPSISLSPGDVIQITDDFIIPADGIAILGEGQISTAILTGESEPFFVTKNSKVEAGSRNLAGHWCLKIENPPGKTRLSQILRETEKLTQVKSHFVRFADQVSRAFILVVFASAVAVVLYFSSIDLGEGFSRALALVIVTCPCVFGIAIPLSMSFAISEAARKGIVIKNADAIEQLWKVKDLYFDKTGTLTDGNMVVTKAQANSPTAFSIALGIERDDVHPVARAISSYLLGEGIEAVQVESGKQVANGGREAQYEGKRYLIQPLSIQSAITREPLALRSKIGIFQDNNLLGEFELGDQIRPEAYGLLEELRIRGYRTHLVSGDRIPVVYNCAQTLNFAKKTVHAQLSPEQKAELIQKSDSNVAMIGDGANDALALSAASVGIAVCGSLDVSLRAADIFLVRPKLNALLDLILIADKTKMAIQRNLIFSVSFNLASGSLAIMGMMSPLWAAVLMPLSSMTVLISAIWTGRNLRLTRDPL